MTKQFKQFKNLIKKVNTPIYLSGHVKPDHDSICSCLALARLLEKLGKKTYVLLDENDNVAEAYSIASGLDYPAVGPEHAYLSDIKRVEYVTINDKEAVDAFFELTKTEGVIPALESSHAVAYGIKLAKKLPSDKIIIVNLSGRGDKDIEFILNNIGLSN